MILENRILSFLLEKRINFWEMVAHLNTMLSKIVKTLKRMEKEGWVEIEDSIISLTEKGKEKATSLNILPQELPKRIDFLPINKDLLLKFKKLRKEGLSKDEFDQLQLLPEAVIKKVELMNLKEDIKGKKIICIGDDDMVGVALALTGLASEICVLDVDKDIINHENEVFKDLKINGQAHFHNLLHKIPAKFKNRYDVFITEPPDTVFGNSLFFSRGVECIKKEGGVGYLGISSTDFSREEYLQVERNILKMKGVITDIFSKFEPYEVAREDRWILNLPSNFGLPKKPWFYSDLLRVEILAKAKPLYPYSFNEKEVSKKLTHTYVYC